jgi:hypothetical protein
MIKEEKVTVKINIRNINSFKSKGYDVKLSDNEIEVSVIDLNFGSKVRITAICELCGSEKSITHNKYQVNKNRNNKGYYSCFSCKNIEKEKTCINKWGVKSYSMTEKFKKEESLKWKGIRKGDEKYKKTMMERYGVDCFFKTDKMRERNREWMSSDEFVNKSKEKMLEKYGVDSYSKTDEFKNRISDLKEQIVEKIRKTCIDKYGVDWYCKTDEFKVNFQNKRCETINKIKKTCLDRYGVDNVSKLQSICDKSRNTRIENGSIIPDELLTEWQLYKREVSKLTNRVKKKLYENWDGYDYYDGEYIKGNFAHSPLSSLYPTIDHKISTYFGFINNIEPEEISGLENLCITKRTINSQKRELTDYQFPLSNIQN